MMSLLASICNNVILNILFHTDMFLVLYMSHAHNILLIHWHILHCIWVVYNLFLHILLYILLHLNRLYTYCLNLYWYHLDLHICKLLIPLLRLLLNLYSTAVCLISLSIPLFHNLIDVSFYKIALLILKIYTCILNVALLHDFFLLLVLSHMLFVLQLFVLYNHNRILYHIMFLHLFLQKPLLSCCYIVLCLVLLSLALTALLMLSMHLCLNLINLYYL
mmetsp:Transcript_4683/g.6932  ORF Transcript_4683/g.6932 Transcript_4683/m.6932 type:complete len:219 (+) Transcript_4683:336-992(+)